VTAEKAVTTGLRGLLDFVVANAGGAHANPLGGARNYGPHLLQIDIPAPVGNIVGVADLMPEHRPAAAHITYFCHEFVLGNYPA